MEINSVNSKQEDKQSLNSTSQRKLKERQVCPGWRRPSSPPEKHWPGPWPLAADRLLPQSLQRRTHGRLMPASVPGPHGGRRALHDLALLPP